MMPVHRYSDNALHVRHRRVTASKSQRTIFLYAFNDTVYVV